MPDSFDIVYRTGKAELTEKKSRFLSFAVPIRSEEEAEQVLSEIRKKYWDANHHCYAYSVGADQATERSSDDREPSGTAGRPILEMIRGQELHNCLVVVVRYFGGVLLGTGGLVRAYGGAAKAALENADVLKLYRGEEWKLTADYSLLGKVQRIFEDLVLPRPTVEYAENVAFVCYLTPPQRDAVLKAFIEITAGKGISDKIRECTYGFCGDELITADGSAEN